MTSINPLKTSRYVSLVSLALWIGFLLGIICLLISPLSMATQIKGLRLWHDNDSTRLVFDLSKSSKYKLFALSNPSRLVIDFKNSRFIKSLAVNQQSLTNTPISALRFSAYKNDSRFVLDLRSPVTYRSFMLPPNQQYGHRLVVDLYNVKTKPNTPNIKSSIPSVARDVSANGHRNIIIAIDAGHGGKDPGASGGYRRRLHEKNIVLSISKILKKLIDKEAGYSALLIRNSDRFIPLRQRPDKARQHSADLFLSIHADAAHNKKAYGASIYALSLRGASSESARYLAQRENNADLIGGIAPINIKNHEYQVAQILIDLSMTTTIETSLIIGKYVLAQLGKVTKLHKSQVEQASFLVLKSPDLPSLLIETGFISNTKEANRLNSKKYQNKLARAILQGIKNYYNKYPPVGTLVYSRINNKPIKIVVKRGDSLSTIAKRYATSIRSIKKANRLKSNRIKVGQTLVIPTNR